MGGDKALSSQTYSPWLNSAGVLRSARSLVLEKGMDPSMLSIYKSGY